MPQRKRVGLISYKLELHVAQFISDPTTGFHEKKLHMSEKTVLESLA